jgi:hypothetical protein
MRLAELLPTRRGASLCDDGRGSGPRRLWPYGASGCAGHGSEAERTGKPNSVLRGQAKGRSFIWADGRPPARAPYPQLRDRQPVPAWASGDGRYPTRRATSCCLFGLAGGGVYPATAVTGRAVRSYRTFSPLPGGSVGATRAPSRHNTAAIIQRCHYLSGASSGGVFSVALSLGSRRVGVTNHRALPSSDFPHVRPANARSPSPAPPYSIIYPSWDKGTFYFFRPFRAGSFGAMARASLEGLPRGRKSRMSPFPEA